MKSYDQFCSLARALDVVGDRWTLLIVRELLIGPSRYTDLRKSLPGIASNLLAERLRALAEAGVVTHDDAPPPVSARVYSLTERGRGLQATLVELGKWGVPYMAAGQNGDHGRGRWLSFAVMALYPSNSLPDVLGGLRVRLDVDDDHLLLVVDGGSVATEPCHAKAEADVTVAGTAEQVFQLLAGQRGDERPAVGGSDESLRRLEAFTTRALTSDVDLSSLPR